MSQAGRRRVRTTFDWKAVMPQYLALADKLADIRKEANPRTMRLSPAVVNPIEVASYSLSGVPDRPFNGEICADHNRVLDAGSLTVWDAVNVALVSQIATDGGLREGIVLAALLFLAKFNYVELSGLEPN